MPRFLCLALLGLSSVAATVAFGEEGRPLSMETIDRVIEAHDRAVQGCHRGGSRHDTTAVQLMLDIDAAGQVVSALPPGDAVAKGETQCLARIAKKLHFPATGVETHIAYPFMLMPQVRR